MQVLTYVAGILTVINGDEYFNGSSEKPSFITGEAFYYEPTLKIMDGEQLSEEMMKSAEDFINSFVFRTTVIETPEVVSEPEYKDYVDSFGNYVYTNYPKETYTEINTKPLEDSNLYVWDFETNEFYSAVAIDSETNHPVGIIKIDEFSLNVYYGKVSNYNKDICNDCQVYNKTTKQFDLNISLIKEKKSTKLNEACLLYIKEQNGDIGNITSAIGNSWYRQEVEARAYILDNTKQTPYIDQILIGRNSKLTELSLPLETKEWLVNKIVEKADAYNILYGNAIGKLSIILKRLEEATDYETIKNITW